jgi:spermidine/putrescine-binding protein
MAQSQNPDIAFAVPAEGAFVFVDNWAIPKGARQKELAEEFINFVLRPEISAMIVNHAKYASVNEAAKPLINHEILNGPSYYWPEGTKLWWLKDFDDDCRRCTRNRAARPTRRRIVSWPQVERCPPQRSNSDDDDLRHAPPRFGTDRARALGAIARSVTAPSPPTGRPGRW